MSTMLCRIFSGLLACAVLLAPMVALAGSGLIDAVKIGVLAHDVPLFDDHTESGVDLNGEVLFTSPAFLAMFGAPRPNLGVTINTLNKTDYAYGGLVWTADFFRGLFRPGDAIFGSLGLGGAIHDRPNGKSPGYVGLGTRLLFHEEGDLGYRINPVWSVSLFVDHISNADISEHNPGLTNLGIRIGYRF